MFSIYLIKQLKMAVFDINLNATTGENGTWKLLIATDYNWEVFDTWDWTNESAIISELEQFTFADMWYYENFQAFVNQWEERIIETDYCGVGEISNKQENIDWFSVDLQEVLEMDNLALILGNVLYTDEGTWEQIIVRKRTMRTKPYLLFKFITCPKEWKYNVFYFVKSRLSNDVSIPFTNLSREDFVGTTMEFEVAKSWNFVIQKWVEVQPESV